VCKAIRPHEEKTMNALTLICQGVATASELMALLFIAPAWAAAPTAPPSAPPLRQMHAMESALEIHWLDSLGGLRVVRALQSTEARPASFTSDSPCGSDAEDDEVGEDNAHAVLNFDEALADLQRRPAGATTAMRTVGASQPAHAGTIVHLAGPVTRNESDAHAFFVVDGAIRYLAIVPPSGMRGEATLTVRPRSGASEVLALGRIDGVSQAILVPRAAREAADDLAIEAIELESRSVDEVSWVTVPLRSSPRGAATATLASVSR
ncbi:MAG: hypothetical protein ACREBN_06390, partial [Burkholderiaceae bacterium]